MGGYPKFVEMGGGIPVPFNIMAMTDDEIREFMRTINGVIYPGGREKFFNDDGTGWDPYTRKSKLVYDEAKKINEEGEYFPLWLVCMGH